MLNHYCSHTNVHIIIYDICKKFFLTLIDQHFLTLIFISFLFSTNVKKFKYTFFTNWVLLIISWTTLNLPIFKP